MVEKIINWNLRPHNKENEKKFIGLGYSRIMARLLSQRKVDPSSIDKFMTGFIKDIENPYALNGMQEAVDIFIDFIDTKSKNESVAVIGDYDADGIISSLMISELCYRLKIKCDVFLPSRLKHGYGLNPKTLIDFKLKHKDSIPYLLIITDCGSNNEKEVLDLKEFGVKKIIIIDHHLVDQNLKSNSADAFINWHESDYEEMCACGEVFQFINALSMVDKSVDLMEYVSYSAVGTLADVSPLNINNRIIVKNGLSGDALNSISSIGLHAIAEDSGIKSFGFSPSDVQFRIVPRINAAGRFADPIDSFKALSEKDQYLSKLMAKQLTEYNDKRKNIQKKIEKTAIKTIEENPDNYKYGIAVYDEDWHIGVVGVVASKLVEKYNKPSIVIGKNGESWKGSGRSIENVNIKKILDSCGECFDKYGGHEMAAGVTAKDSMIKELNKRFNDACKKYYKEAKSVIDNRYYDAVLRPEYINKSISREIRNKLLPYCNVTNPEPIFKINNATIVNAEVKEGKNWQLLRFEMEKDGTVVPLKASTFSEKYGSEISGMKANVYFSFSQNESYQNSVNVVAIEKLQDN